MLVAALLVAVLEAMQKEMRATTPAAFSRAALIPDEP
jgi:hypothetical protein